MPLVNSRADMTYIVTETCVDLKDKSCIEVCPVDCIHEADEDRMVYIDPDECIDCGACVDPCPVDAIYAEEDVPETQIRFRRHQQGLLQGQGARPYAGRGVQAGRRELNDDPGRFAPICAGPAQR